MADKERLIDTGKLIGYLHEKTFIDGDDRSMVYKAIEEQPTIEAEPVKHGRWIVTKTERGWNCAEYPVEWTCSECKVANDREDGFCPHCGARMDGDNND